MLRCYLKIPPLKKILQFQDRICFFIKNPKNNHSSESDWRKNTKSRFKDNPRTFCKNSNTQKNIRILKLKEDCKTYTKKKTSNQKLKQWLKTCKMNFINQKKDKAMVLNLMLILDMKWSAKKCSKFFKVLNPWDRG